MAKMIPARIDDGVVMSERKVFDLIARDPSTKDWTVLHSLGLSRRRTGPYGEIDFVVIIPGEGIVCMEVKGGRVSSHGGEWTTMNQHGSTSKLNKSPFMQARESTFALRDSIRNRFGHGDESECPIGYGVIFPDVAYPPITPEFERWEVIDYHDLRESISKHIMKIVRNRLRPHQPRGSARLPTGSQARSIRKFLCPDFDMVVAKSVTTERNEERLLSLTQEQYTRLDELEDNPRCLFRGAAGTGKTLLAVEKARRAAHDGKKVLLVCFNRLLAGWLSEQTSGAGIIVGTWHEVARRFILDSSIGDDFLEEERRAFESPYFASQRKLFDETYHEYAGLAIQEHIERGDRQFDILVVDEAQDILGNENVVEFLDLALKDGFADGNWAIFGDFTPQQALYGDPVDPIEVLENYTDYFVRSRLTLNCRNTLQIAKEVSEIAGEGNPTCRMDAEVGLPVERRYLRTGSHIAEELTTVIERIVKNDDVSVEDIVVLAPRRLANSPLAGTDRISKFPLADITDRNLTIEQPSIKFSTIQAFKGLESPVVIMVDVDESGEEWMKSVLYVGMSRAQSLLVLMIGRHGR